MFELFLNKQFDKTDYLATVTNLSPLEVELIPNDTAIPVVSTTGLIGLKVGSRVLLKKTSNQFIAIAVIGSP